MSEDLLASPGRRALLEVWGSKTSKPTICRPARAAPAMNAQASGSLDSTHVRFPMAVG